MKVKDLQEMFKDLDPEAELIMLDPEAKMAYINSVNVSVKVLEAGSKLSGDGRGRPYASPV